MSCLSLETKCLFAEKVAVKTQKTNIINYPTVSLSYREFSCNLLTTCNIFLPSPLRTLCAQNNPQSPWLMILTRKMCLILDPWPAHISVSNKQGSLWKRRNFKLQIPHLKHVLKYTFYNSTGMSNIYQMSYIEWVCTILLSFFFHSFIFLYLCLMSFILCLCNNDWGIYLSAIFKKNRIYSRGKCLKWLISVLICVIFTASYFLMWNILTMCSVH